ncbi:hypothetical protein O988_00563 [Pseudogymnoascus sp. VKM F-3808]|nr:hypothetical protein O988_00563 [Pseudogymnoascus sp. VKM F-3808]
MPGPISTTTMSQEPIQNVESHQSRNPTFCPPGPPTASRAEQGGNVDQAVVAADDVDPNSLVRKPFPFLKLPVELREIIWNMALDDLKGKIIMPILSHCADSDGDSFPRYYTKDTIRPPAPALLYVCRESRHIAMIVYSDGQEALFDPARDRLLVLPERHLEHLNVEFWRHARHIIYYAPKLADTSTRPSKQIKQLVRSYSSDLRMRFHPRAEGLPIQTITVLTDKVLKDDIWTLLHSGWHTPWDNDDISTDSPVREMIRDNDIATVRQVEQILYNAQSRPCGGLLIGHAPPQRVIAARPGRLKREAMEADLRIERDNPGGIQGAGEDSAEGQPEHPGSLPCRKELPRKLPGRPAMRCAPHARADSQLIVRDTIRGS